MGGEIQVDDVMGLINEILPDMGRARASLINKVNSMLSKGNSQLFIKEFDRSSKFRRR